MILLNDLYSIVNRESTTGSVKATLFINTSHKIFDGHFPGLPVVPGVCMVQMVRELLEVSENKEFRIETADNIKFLSVIDPRQHEKVSASIDYTQSDTVYTINATLFADQLIFLKLRATLRTV
ncbi:MAG TPA: hydroxymyristoyl-ACP dehydratase [Chryseolinea sp.]|nr:hydroxymyristoyl-ACP dehydratase [Chryseolinea sp.]HPM31135.1 hydroxymyristoyl-ACP dehydratase [Chryseolinea sp.]